MLFKDLTLSAVLLLAFFLESGFIIGGMATYVANRHAEMQVKKARWFKFFTYFLITHCMVLAASAGGTLFSLITIVLTVGGAFEILNASLHSQFSNPFIPASACGLYFLAIAGTIFFAAHASSGAALYVYLILCILDGFSQIVGQLICKHRLSSAISPNKTIEGAASGAVFAIVTAIVFRSFVRFDFIQALLCGVLLSCAGIFGDLLASCYKRLCGIKDYSSLLPGQGGIVDRFNSFFAAAPVFYVYIFVLNGLK